VAQEFKPFLRQLFGQVSANLNSVPAELPDGVDLIQLPECLGLVFSPGKVDIQPSVWSVDEGLLEQFARIEQQNPNILAALNGAFFRPDGILGPVIIDGVVPEGVKLFPGKLSRCFLAVVEEEGRRRWLIGESSKKPAEMAKKNWLGQAAVNRRVTSGERLVHLIGGAGWIVRNSQDVHMEAFQRQNFRFRRVDQDSRHSVVAMDKRNRLFFLVFETGANLQRCSEILRGRPEFGEITEAIFFDGGSSSTLVYRGTYLTAPLYLVDKSRFSAILAFFP
jgi:hypothetical protein